MLDRAITQHRMMAEYIRRIRGAPPLVAVIPKAVESEADVAMEPMPPHVIEHLDGGLGRDVYTFFYAALNNPHKNHVTLVGALDMLRRQNVVQGLP